MKNLIACLILISGILFIPVRSDANVTLICTTPSGVVSVFAISCASAYPGNKTSSLPGLTSGLCAKVISADLAMGTCSSGGITSINGDSTLVQTIVGDSFITVSQGGGGETDLNLNSSNLAQLDGNNTFSGTNTFSLGINSGSPNSYSTFGTFGVGTGGTVVIDNSATHCSVATNVSAFRISHSPVGILFCMDISGRTEFSNTVNVNADLSSTGTIIAGNGFSDSVGSGANLMIGHTGAPSGTCTNGSIYTRSDGTPGAILYVCESNSWVAATTP